MFRSAFVLILINYVFELVNPFINKYWKGLLFKSNFDFYNF
jgi:hypothetical protein